MDIGKDYIGVTTPFYCHDGKGNFLFGKRGNACRDERGHWDPGSGKLEFGLTIQENVLKEIQEEYGCGGVIQEQLPGHSIIRNENGVRSHWLVIPSFVLINPSEAKNNEPHKIDDIGWFRLDALPHPIHEGFWYAFNTYKKYFEKYM